MEKTMTRRILVIITILAMLVCFPAADLHAAGTKQESSQGDDIRTIVQNMTPQEKITQCMMIDFRKWNDASGDEQDMTVLQPDVADIIKNYKFGAMILFAENIKETKETLALTKDVQAAATSEGGLPMIMATDQEGGVVYRLGSGTALPGNMAVAATGDPANARITGQIIGRELESVAINTTLAPVIDVNNNPSNPVIGVRSFSDDPDIVGEYGGQYIAGLDEYNIIGCAKHFPGHGDTKTDSHYGLPEVNKSKEELMKNELKPYKIAIKSGIDMIMTAHILYPKLDSTKVYSEKTGKEESRPATLSKKILTELLRGELGFDGVVITDAMNMKGVANNFTMGQATAEALNAGADLVCMPVTGIYDKTAWTTEMNAVISYVEQHVNEARLNESVERILELKQKKGILDYNASAYTRERAEATVGSKENRALEREMAAKAVTVVRNDNGILPCKLSSGAKILMMAPYNNEMAQMVMGLNRAKQAGLVPGDVQVKIYRFSDTDYEIDGARKDAMDWADLIIINSEQSGASTMDYKHWLSAGPKAYTDYSKANGKKSIIMSINKPYDVQLYPAADAVLAAYGYKGSNMLVTDELLRGDITSDTQACGPNIVAGVEVAFGVFDATGRLPVNVPVYDQKTGDFTDQLLYKRGYKYDPDLKAGSLTLSKERFEYTGKAIQPGEVVKDAGGFTLTRDKYYTVTCKNNVKVGTATVTVTGKGGYSGSISKSFTIQPGKAGIRSVKAKKRALTVTMTSAPGKTGGSRYQIAYKVKGKNTWKYKTTTKAKVKIKKLKRHKKYQVKVRACKKVNGKTYYGAWSKTVTSKKVR